MKSFQTVNDIIFLQFTVFPNKFSLAKTILIWQNLISSIANLVYELPHELPNNLRLTTLGN